MNDCTKNFSLPSNDTADDDLTFATPKKIEQQNVLKFSFKSVYIFNIGVITLHTAWRQLWHKFTYDDVTNQAWICDDVFWLWLIFAEVLSSSEELWMLYIALLRNKQKKGSQLTAQGIMPAH